MVLLSEAEARGAVSYRAFHLGGQTFGFHLGGQQIGRPAIRRSVAVGRKPIAECELKVDYCHAAESNWTAGVVCVVVCFVDSFFGFSYGSKAWFAALAPPCSCLLSDQLPSGFD